MDGRDVLWELARRLHCDRTLRSALDSYAATSRFAASVRWTPAGWGFGGAGLAMLCAQAHRAGGGDVWAHRAHEYLRYGVAGLAAERGLGLFDGATGFGFVAATLAEEGSYTTLAAQLARRLVPAIGAAAAAGAGPFDLLSGLAGHGVYLNSGAGDEQARLAVRQACDRSLRLSGAHPLAVPVAAEDDFPARVATSVQCGMAHGVAGLIATRARLALADGEAGPTLDTLRAATSWLMAQRTDTLLWPRAVLFDRDHRVCGQVSASSLSWWCTGSAGIARSLWLAGTATGTAQPCELAMDVMERLAADRSSWPSNPGLCHGVAGLLVIAREFARDTGRAEVLRLADALTDLLVERFDEAALLGFRNVESSGVAVDDPGVMYGTTGVALGLAFSSGRSGWVRAMGL
ncbi:lanthionine synthetase LanC family protein [Nonomuraea sp. NPDC050790]|uniref:lanthionine synthetase LanC family protein n=1 Tax=Nonomuraea sp. NPDC050790 TaxID=3364371 RepID=UPI00379DE741